MNISNLIKDEEEAIDGYNKFLNEHPLISDKMRSDIKMIIHDEKRHIRMLRRMKK